LFKVKLQGLFCCDIFSTGGNNNCFAELIYHNKHGVVVIYGRKVGDEVHHYGFPDAKGYLIGL
jgi:hypothetical protein